MILNSPLSLVTAASVTDWLSHDNVAPLNPGDRHLELFRQNLTVPGSGPNLVTDAHIAALAIKYDAELHSNDSDFKRFSDLRWHNPLQ